MHEAASTAALWMGESEAEGSGLAACAGGARCEAGSIAALCMGESEAVDQQPGQVVLELDTKTRSVYCSRRVSEAMA